LQKSNVEGEEIMRWIHGRALHRVLLISVLALGLLFGSLMSASAQAPIGTITSASVLNVRSGPGVGFGAIARINRGAVVTLIGRNADATWAQIQLASGAQGWINAHYMTPSVPLANLPVTYGTTVSNGVVSASFLNVRSGPSAGFGVVGTLGQGEAVNLIARTEDSTWVQVQLSNGVQGWVNSSWIIANIRIWTLPVAGTTSGVPTAPPPANASPTGIITAYRLNVRSGPGMNHGIVTQVSQGQSVSLLGRTAFNDWLLIQAPNGFTGWINSNYVLSSTQFGTLPVRF
jgi:N-acetylmuramoyl-L-alanine amidase